MVVGSGPGGLQISYYLSRLGIGHAVISADPAPGGMFRQFPFFQRLLSWTKPHTRHALDTREYERYDFNSLVAFEPENRALMPRFMDGTSEFPSRAEMEAGLVEFVDRDFYSEWPIKVDLLGTYHELGLFFDRLSRFSRIINVDDLQITPLRRGEGEHFTIHARFTQKTFIYKEEGQTP